MPDPDRREKLILCTLRCIVSVFTFALGAIALFAFISLGNSLWPFWGAFIGSLIAALTIAAAIILVISF